MDAQMKSEENGTEEVDKLAEKYKEFIALYNTEKYFQCIELCLEFESSSEEISHKESALEWKQKSARAAAEYFYTKARYSEMQSVLIHLSYEEQYCYLNAKDDCEEYLVQLFKDHDKKDLLINYYKKKRMYLEAAQTESDLRIKAKYFCIAVRQSYLSRNVEQANIACDAIDGLLKDELDPNVRYELLFNKIQIDHDTEFSIIKEMYLHYSKEKNLLMQLLSLLTCTQRFPELVLELISSDHLIALKYMIDFCDSLFKIIIRQCCNITISSEESLLSDFGMQKDVDDSNMIFYEDETKLLFLHVKTSGNYKDPLQNETRINISLARIQISNILFRLVLEMISFCNFQLKSKIKKSLSVIHVESNERCAESHDYPSAASFETGIHLIITLLEYQAQSKAYHKVLLRKNKHDANEIKELQKLSDSKETIFTLNEYLLYYLSYAHLVEIEQYSSCLRNIPESVHNLIVDYIKEMWKELEDLTQYVNMNIFMYLSFLSYMLNLKDPLTDKKFHGLALEYSMRKIITDDYLTYFELFLVEEKRFDYCYSKFKQCLYNAIQYQEPTVFTLCELIELPLVMFFSSLLKLEPSMTLYLPERMIAYKDLMDGVYGINVYEVINKKVYYHNKSSICSGMQTILNILTGYRDFSFNLIPILRRHISGFQDGSDETIEKLSCERLLIIILVFLCNFPNFSFLRGRDRIIKEFKKFPIQGEGKLADLFNQISKISSDEHCKRVLANHLNHSKQNLVSYCFSGTRGNYYEDMHENIPNSVDSGECTSVRGNTDVPAIKSSQEKVSNSSSIEASHEIVVKTEKECLNANTSQRLRTTICTSAIQKPFTNSTSLENSEGSATQTICNVGKENKPPSDKKEDNALRSSSLKRKLDSYSVPDERMSGSTC